MFHTARARELDAAKPHTGATILQQHRTHGFFNTIAFPNLLFCRHNIAKGTCFACRFMPLFCRFGLLLALLLLPRRGCWHPRRLSEVVELHSHFVFSLATTRRHNNSQDRQKICPLSLNICIKWITTSVECSALATTGASSSCLATCSRITKAYRRIS